jgi:hypothetical protein
VIVINKADSDGIVQSRKDVDSREAHLSRQVVVDVLKTMIAERRRQCFTAGKPMPPLLFCNQGGGMINRTYFGNRNGPTRSHSTRETWIFRYR